MNNDVRKLPQINISATTPDGNSLLAGFIKEVHYTWEHNLSEELKNYLLHIPLEQGLIIQAFRTRMNSHLPFALPKKAQDDFQQLRPDAQEFFRKELNIHLL
jgi:hypothetical protein